MECIVQDSERKERGLHSRKIWATLAQLVERLIRNQQVASSILAGGSIEVNSSSRAPSRLGSDQKVVFSAIKL